MATHERTPLIEPDSAAAHRGASRPRSVSRLASVGALGALAVVAALTGTTRVVSRAVASAGDDDVFAVGVFDDVPERRADVRVEGLDRPRTLPWQPVSEGGSKSSDHQTDASSHAFGAVSGHGLHCDMRAMAWLFADVPASIPTAVFGARASSREDSKLGAGADSWLEGIDESSPTFSALEDALVRRVGFEAQAGDFAAVADAAGYRNFVAVGESQSTAAALWAGVRQAEASRDAGATKSVGRIKGLVLTLVPSMGPERKEKHLELREMIATTFGTNATALNGTAFERPSNKADSTADFDFLRDLEDCSVGYGCVPFAKYLAAKASDLPSTDALRALRPWFPPALVLADYADEPAHPVENGRLVAEALGARFEVVNTREEREARWPRAAATFIKEVHDAETGEEALPASDEEASVARRSTRKRVFARRRRLLDAYDDASASLVLTENQLRASSQLCVGDHVATPALESRCESLTAEESEAWEAEKAAREAFEEATEGGVTTGDAFADAPPPRALSPFYLRTGLSVEECDESDLGNVRRGRVTE
jgi:pimeloyl-ACP methyl ester carboxylesterase